jgi:hypothetical protein
MDNIGVLRQAQRETSNEPLVLFDPADATRSVSRGVAVDYYLKDASEGVAIDILDSQNQVIRSFKTEPEPAAGTVQAAPPEEDEDSPRAPVARVTGKKGMNRFTWDMRYPNAREFPGLIMWAGNTRGPQAPPGRYGVRLTTGGVSRTQQFEIRRNAALPSVTDADLVEQFRLARQINEKVSSANDAVVRIRGIKSQIAERLGKTNNAATKKAGAALTERLTDVEGEIYQYRNRSSQDPLNYPIRLNNKLAALQGIVESGDSKPTAQSYEVFKELSGRLDKELARLDALVKGELAAFNKQLSAARLEPVKDATGNPAPPSPPQRQEAPRPPRTARPDSPSRR